MSCLLRVNNTHKKGYSSSSGEKRVRNSSSDSESNYIKPHQKQAKMDTVVERTQLGHEKGMADLFAELHSIKASMSQLRSEQSMMDHNLTSSIESLKKDIMQTINNRFDALSNRIDMETSQIVSRMDSLDSRISSLEKQVKLKVREPFDPEVTVVAFGVKYSPGEDSDSVAREIIHDAIGLSEIPIVRSHRFGSRDGRAGLLKIEFNSVEDKVQVLRNKQNLKSSDLYSRTFIRSSHSHAERLIELNFKTILNELPNGGSYHVTGNGRVVKKRDSNNLNGDVTQKKASGLGRGYSVNNSKPQVSHYSTPLSPGHNRH